ncbi:MAG: LysR family transcriptional regulator [Alphaproteobacteria bacterium]|nr:LysR family transcriptional regulator [Alphaproteobacteria bacterium]
MNAQTLDWGDMPFLLAVCEAGTLSGAARKLGVNHSTVFRRIEAVEARLGVTLFERLSHGYVMTTAGEHFFQQAVVMKEGMIRIQRELSGQDLRLEGILTVTTTDSLVYYLTPVFRDFQRQYPDVELRLLSDVRSFDLMQRDADIALRPTRQPPEHWIGRELTSIPYATYVHTDYLDVIENSPPESHHWILLEDNLNRSPMGQISAEQKMEGAPVTITSSVMAMFDLIRANLGIAVLPCYMAENTSELVQLHRADTKFNTDLWMLAHPDIRRSAKVHAFFEFATARIRDDGSGFFKQS